MAFVLAYGGGSVTELHRLPSGSGKHAAIAEGFGKDLGFNVRRVARPSRTHFGRRAAPRGGYRSPTSTPVATNISSCWSPTIFMASSPFPWSSKKWRASAWEMVFCVKVPATRIGVPAL